MGIKLQNAPVFYTVAQIRFNPCLSLDSFIPTIQEEMRLSGFPDYKPSTYQELALTFAEPGTASKPSFVSHARCVFGDIQGTTNFILENSALSLQTTSYDTFETFSECFLKGLAIINNTLKLSFFERIGIRYLDAILPREGESLELYLAPEALGLFPKFSDVVHCYSETLTKNDSGSTMSRVIIQNGQVKLPPELDALSPKLREKFSKYTGLHAILDTDAFYEGRHEFNLMNIKDILFAQKQSIRKTFGATVTPEAMAIWLSAR